MVVNYELLKERLKNARLNKGYTLEEVAKKLDVYKSSVLRWEQGNVAKIKLPVLEKLAEIYDVNIDWLIGDSSEMEVNVVASKILSASPNIKGVLVPVYSSIPAGVPLEMLDTIIDYEEIPPEMCSGGRQYFGVQVHGDSMYPRFQDNDVIIVLAQNDCESGQDCVVSVGNTNATLKRVVKLDDAIMLQPFNQKYEPVIYKAKEIRMLPVKILGVVKELRRKF